MNFKFLGILAIVLLALSTFATTASADDLDYAGSMEVVVKDQSGDPVSDAIVSVTKLPFTHIAKDRTDSNGRITIDSLEAGNYQVWVSKEGYFRQVQETKLVSGENITLTYKLLAVENLSSAVHVFVYDKDTQQGIPGATIDFEGSASFVGTTNVHGEYTKQDIENGTYKITISKEGYSSKSATTRFPDGIGSIKNLVFRLEETQTGQARTGAIIDVYDDITRELIPYAKFSLVNSTTGQDYGEFEADESGHIELELSEGRYTITALVEGYYNGVFGFSVSAGEVTEYQMMIIPLEEPELSKGYLSLTVIDAETGEGISQAKVILRRHTGEIQEHTTTGNGMLRLELYEGQYRLSVSKENYQGHGENIHIFRNEETSVEVKLKPTSSSQNITGTLLVSVFEKVPVRAYETAEAAVPQASEPQESETQGEEVESVTTPPSSGGSGASPAMLPQGGKPVPGAKVACKTILSNSGEEFVPHAAEGITDRNGKARLELMANVQYHCVATKEGYSASEFRGRVKENGTTPVKVFLSKRMGQECSVELNCSRIEKLYDIIRHLQQRIDRLERLLGLHGEEATESGEYLPGRAIPEQMRIREMKQKEMITSSGAIIRPHPNAAIEATNGIPYIVQGQVKKQLVVDPKPLLINRLPADEVQKIREVVAEPVIEENELKYRITYTIPNEMPIINIFIPTLEKTVEITPEEISATAVQIEDEKQLWQAVEAISTAEVTTVVQKELPTTSGAGGGHSSASGGAGGGHGPRISN